MATYFSCFGLFLYFLAEVNAQVKDTPKTLSASSGRPSSFVFSAKNQFSFSSPKSDLSNTGGTGRNENPVNNQQQSNWKQIPYTTFEQNKGQTQEQQQPQHGQQQFQNQQNQMGGFQNGQQFSSSMGMGGQQSKMNTFTHGQGQQNLNQMNSQQQTSPQQLSNMNHGQPGMFNQQQQQQQQQFGQQNNIPNGHNSQFGSDHSQFGGLPTGNGISVFSQNGPSNMPPYQGINMMQPTQQGFQHNQQQGLMTQFNPQHQAMSNGRQFFNHMPGPQGSQMPGHQGSPMAGHQGSQMPTQQNNQMPGQQVGPMSGQPNPQGQNQGMLSGQMVVPSPNNQMHGQVGGHMSGPTNINMPGQHTGQMTGPSMPTGPHGGPQFMGQGQPFKPDPNLAVIDHPMAAQTTTTTTPKPPTSTVDGEGFVCMTTADCEIGCCFNSTGQLLDTSTYGAGGPKEGRSSGKCFIRSPGLGDVCDDLCPCSVGHDCYRRYVPSYPAPGQTAPPPVDPEGSPKPQRVCVRSAVVEAERRVFWMCYFDQACSGPLP